jgi:hypothetical protein
VDQLDALVREGKLQPMAIAAGWLPRVSLCFHGAPALQRSACLVKMRTRRRFVAL